ncbi:MAG: hypothetical protein HYR96_14940 [Deltaproteobacteria bacterium]|nr:hypothetical protein [Deltaproteobacteria bacterium]MBI3293666.1 hypothetical protein [Deltaproteobacteria bacterium]
MRWDWDSTGDNRVAKMWHLREELSRSGKVVYAKWYKGRATFFSKTLAAALIRALDHSHPMRSLSRNAHTIHELLLEDSPQSSKILKKRSEKEQGLTPKEFDKGLTELWQSLRIVGYGEVDDGAFPSLNIGATSALFEDLCRKATGLSEKAAIEDLAPISETPFIQQLNSFKSRPATGPKVKVIRFSDIQ